MTDLPALITDPAAFGDGYIYVPHWEDFQHRDALRSGPPMRWHKHLTEQLDHDQYRELSPSARGLLIDLRTLVARMGQGRCTARAQRLQSLCSFPAGHVHRHLVSLVQAGFIEVRAGKLPAARQQAAGTEESRVRVASLTAGLPSTSQRARTPQEAATRADLNGQPTTEHEQTEQERLTIALASPGQRGAILAGIRIGNYDRTSFGWLTDTEYRQLNLEAHAPAFAPAEPDDGDAEL